MTLMTSLHFFSAAWSARLIIFWYFLVASTSHKMAILSRHDHTKLNNLPLQRISDLVPFSGLVISIALIVLFLIRYYILEGFLIKRLYGAIYTELDERNRCGFINHHIAGFTKIAILIVAAYPFVVITCGNATFHKPYAPGSIVTLGDVIVVAAQILIAMYIFELIYRVKLSPIAVLHHTGTVLIV
jgi:hypothetical protein